MCDKITNDVKDDIRRWVQEHGLKKYGGATVKSMCEYFGFTDRTFQRHMKKPEFAAMIEEAQIYFRDHLEHDLVMSLAKAAKGYTAIKRRTKYVKDKSGNPMISEQVTEDVEVPPNIGAAIFLLTNINPSAWVNKQAQQTELQGAVSIGVKMLSDATPDIATNESDIPE